MSNRIIVFSIQDLSQNGLKAESKIMNMDLAFNPGSWIYY